MAAHIASHIGYLWHLTKYQKRRFISLLILIILGVLIRLAKPYLYKIFVDTLVEGLQLGTFESEALKLLFQVLIIWVIVAVTNNIINGENSFLGWEIGSRNSQIAHSEGFRRLLRLDYEKHTRKSSDYYAKIVDDADTAVWDLTNWWLTRIISAAFGFFGMLAIAFSVNVLMTLAALAIIPPYLAVIIFLIIKYENQQQYINKLWMEKHEHMADHVSNIATYKLNEDEMRMLALQKTFSDKATDAQLELNKKWRLVDMINPDTIAHLLVISMAAFLITKGQITVGTLFMFMSLLNEILTPLHILSDILPQYSRKAHHVNRMLKLFNTEDAVREVNNPIAPRKIKGEISFQNVLFVSEAGRPILKNINFKIKFGEKIALVGHSGAGKTTIAVLINRLYDASAGHILIDNIDIKKYSKEALHRHIGTVLQDNAMYNTSIFENIKFAKPDAKEAEIIEAAKKAQADEFIKKLPHGYHTNIGYRGVRLSGGEKQRIAIARAILKNPQIIILDEPTSALDSIIEKEVQQAISALIKNKTAVIIAHRLSTVLNTDRIFVIEKGQLIAQGKHKRLLKICSVYKKMAELQSLPD